MNFSLSLLFLGLAAFAIDNCSAEFGYDDEHHMVRRQANQNAMDRALTNKPVGQPDFSGHYYGGQFQDSKNFGARVGGSAGVKVYENGPHSVGVGVGLDSTVGMNRGKPFMMGTDVGVGAGYRYRFRRSPLEDDLIEDDDVVVDVDEKDQYEVDDHEDHVIDRVRRQATQNAMDRALTNNPVGKPDFSGHYYGGNFQDRKNFAAAVGGSAGVKVFEKGPHSVGVGAGLDSTVGMNRGKPFMTRPNVGVGVGYTFRFRRSPLEGAFGDEEDVMDDVDVKENDYEVQQPEDYTSIRVRRQANRNAMDRSMTNKPVGKPEFRGHYYGGAFKDSKNFGARVGASVGAKVYENGRHSVGVGAGVDANVGRSGGRPFVSRPDYGVGASYKFRF